MILVGNSHVTLFKPGCMLPDRPEEEVGIHWIGAPVIEDFVHGHPAARKVRDLFGREDGWKLLLIGTHDVFKILEARDRKTAFTSTIAL
ncbi:MAG: hypothetical protein KGR26_00260, partial [Cyanobacteria bacterium REEB65]|nr:hypothetical protein [Cyanobacteria bacterium REEB65]